MNISKEQRTNTAFNNIIHTVAYIRNHFSPEEADAELVKAISYIEEIREEIKKGEIDLEGISDEPADVWTIH